MRVINLYVNYLLTKKVVKWGQTPNSILLLILIKYVMIYLIKLKGSSMIKKIYGIAVLAIIGLSGCSQTPESVAEAGCKALSNADYKAFTSLIQKEELDKKGLAITMLEGMIKEESFQARFKGISCATPSKTEKTDDQHVLYTYAVNGKSVMRIRVVNKDGNWFLTNRR